MITKFLKKLVSVSCLLLVALSLAACGSSDTEEAYDEAAVYAAARGVISIYDSVRPDSYDQVSELSEEELEEVVDMLSQQGLKISAEAFGNGFQSYISAREELGDITDISDAENISARGDEITCHVIVTGTNSRPDGLPRQADIEVVMSKSYAISSAGFNVIQTTGEKLAHAGLNTLLGMGTTFIILILISIVIYLLSFVPKLLEGGSRSKKKDSPVDKTIDQIIAKEESANEVKKETKDDNELIAVISAAIAAYESAATGRAVSPDTFIVRSLKKH